MLAFIVRILRNHSTGEAMQWEGLIQGATEYKPVGENGQHAIVAGVKNLSHTVPVFCFTYLGP